MHYSKIYVYNILMYILQSFIYFDYIYNNRSTYTIIYIYYVHASRWALYVGKE